MTDHVETREEKMRNEERAESQLVTCDCGCGRELHYQAMTECPTCNAYLTPDCFEDHRVTCGE
jgi:hypothetical protein